MTDDERIRCMVAEAPRPTRQQIAQLALLLFAAQGRRDMRPVANAGGSDPPARERRPQARGAELRANVTVRRGCDTATITPTRRPEETGTQPISTPGVDPSMRADTSGGVR